MEITQGLLRAVQQGSDAPATVFMERTRTWAESAERIARLAAALRGLGVQPGDRVAILSANSDVYHEFMFAACWIGAAFVPVNTRWSLAEIAFALEDAAAAVLLVDENFASLVPELRTQAPVVEHVLFDGDGPGPDEASSVEEVIAGSEPVAEVRRGGDALAAIFYTGGTTGVPKGVMLSHDNLIVSALGSMASGHWIGSGTTYLHTAPMFHAADISGWIAVNLVGGTHVFAPRFDAGAVARMVEQHRVTDTVLVPTMIQMLVDSPEAAHADMSSLRRLLYGGSPISEALIERTAARLPGTRLTQTYAMTEMSPVIALLGPEEHHDPLLRRSGGRAAPHVEMRIVDEDDNDLPPGTAGQIVARGGGRMLGYWNRPKETAEALANGWMHTGDAGYLDDDGYLFVVDRVKDMIISGGENVYSTEVENTLATHSTVGMCAVIGVPDPRWGERVHAVVLPAGDTRATEEELRRHVRERIAGYKVPRSFEFVDSLPMSGAGKILKRELRARHWSHQERHVS